MPATNADKLIEMNLFPSYKEFINIFVKQGYIIAPLSAGDRQKEGRIYMRHDIDFDIGLALEMAAVEKSLGFSSAYFFMLTSDNYNLLTKESLSMVQQIQDMGHTISIHFDPQRYDESLQGLQSELQIFELIFGITPDLVSIHRPSEIFFSEEKYNLGISHTYLPEYIKDIKYVSDSRGSFRFGAPDTTEAFRNRESIHLLIHPIWWMQPKPTTQQVLDTFTEMKFKALQIHIESNCISYKRADSTLRLTKSVT